jgi:sugar phosphate isomerase/epimerase
VYLGVFGKALAFCRNCGIHTLRVDSASPPQALAPDEYEIRLARLAGTWHAAAAEAAKDSVRLVWEFEPGFWLNKPSEVMRLAEAVNHENFKLLFDTSHAYMGAVIAARQTGVPERLRGGVAEYGRLAGPRIGHLHLIDSDGSLHNAETSTHAAFGQGRINFVEVLSAIQPYVADLPWWCVDFCFNPETASAGRAAPAFVRRLMDQVLP